MAGSAVFAAGRGVIPPSLTMQQQSDDDEPPILRAIRRNLNAVFEGHEMGLDFRRINNNGGTDFYIQINADELYPVASAFKSFLILYYFFNTPMDEWDYGPESTVYRVGVYSNNYLTGVLMDNVSRRVAGRGNAVEKFNNFLMNTLGMQEGLYGWNWPSSPTVGANDPRFVPSVERQVHVRNRSEWIDNVTTAADLARGWTFIARAEHNLMWQTEQFREAILATREVLSIPADVYRSPIEKVLYGGYIGKDGTLPIGDISLGRVINDAGIVQVEDGQYVISFTSTGETEQFTDPALSTVIDSIRQYQAYLNPRTQIVIAGDSARIRPNEYNYGFVRNNNISLYLRPTNNAPEVDNPVRRSSLFGTPYLMQGAMVRFLPVNRHWGQIIPDDNEDDVFTYTDWSFGFQDANWNEWNMFTRQPVFVRLEDLLIIEENKIEQIDYVTAVDNPVDKFIIMYVPARQLTLFEGITPILKTPIVLNTQQTPRGRLYVNRRYVARNMPHYPGVPYTNFLHDGGDLNQEGFAIHGAPWHLWDETVTEWETVRRYSHGCINIPNWTMPIGDYELPVDEFIFRWIGKFPNWGNDTVRFTEDEAVRVLSLNNPYREVHNYSIFDSMRQTGTGWGDIIASWEAKPIDAPNKFFVNPFNRDNVELLAPTGFNDQTE